MFVSRSTLTSRRAPNRSEKRRWLSDFSLLLQPIPAAERVPNLPLLLAFRPALTDRLLVVWRKALVTARIMPSFLLDQSRICFNNNKPQLFHFFIKQETFHYEFLWWFTQQWTQKNKRISQIEKIPWCCWTQCKKKSWQNKNAETSHTTTKMPSFCFRQKKISLSFGFSSVKWKTQKNKNCRRAEIPNCVLYNEYTWRHSYCGTDWSWS